MSNFRGMEGVHVLSRSESVASERCEMVDATQQKQFNTPGILPKTADEEQSLTFQK